MAERETITRRHLIATSVAGALILPAAAQGQGQTEKLGQADAEYQPTPKNGQQCSECTKFQPPQGCSVVAGTINPKGWCKLYEAPPE